MSKVSGSLLLLALALGATSRARELGVQPIAVQPSALEPSILNEVNRALDLSEVWLTQRWVGVDVFGTNGLNRTQVAQRLISLQRVNQGKAYWHSPTNALSDAEATTLARQILLSLSTEDAN